MMHDSKLMRFSRKYLLSGLVLGGLALLSPGAIPAAQAFPPIFSGGLERCSGSAFETDYGVTCGSDSFTSGSIYVNSAFRGLPFYGLMRVNVRGAQPLTLYEVYWLADGSANVSSAVKAGNFATDSAGDSIDARLKTITTGADIGTSGGETNIRTVTGLASGTGKYLVYSRGTYGRDTNGDGEADCFNTASSPCDADATRALNNPALGSLTNGTQFVSKKTVGY